MADRQKRGENGQAERRAKLTKGKEGKRGEKEKEGEANRKNGLRDNKRVCERENEERDYLRTCKNRLNRGKEEIRKGVGGGEGGNLGAVKWGR